MTNTVDHPEDTILHDLQAHGLLADAAGWKVVPAEGGLNSRVFFAGRDDTAPQFTVRLSHPGKEWMLQREAAVLNQLGETCACVPTVRGLLQREAGVLLVHNHAAGKPLALAIASAAQLLTLGGCLATVHRHVRDCFAIWPELVDMRGTRAEALLARLGAVERYASFSRLENQDLFHGIQHVYRHLQQSRLDGDAWEERTFSQLHGDLSPGNMLWNGSDVTLIDWEYTRPGDPAEDLAYLVAEQEVPGEQKQLLFHGYVNAGGDPTAISRVPAYAALVSLDSVLWWADLCLKRGDEPAASTEIAYHLSRARQALGGT